MEIELIQDFADIPLYPEVWNNLLQKSNTNSIFQTYQWIESWWETYGDNNQLFILIAKEKHEIVGIAPLMLVGNAPTGKIVKFIGDGKSDYCDFIISQNHDQVINEFMQYIIDSESLWDSIQLNNIPQDSRTSNRIKKITSSIKLKSLFFENIHCPALLFNGDTDKYLKRRSFRRHLNYFNKNGQLQYFEINDKEEILLYLDVLFNQHIQRWRSKGEISLFQDHLNREFYTTLSKNILNTGWLMFSVVEYKGTPIALHFGFDYNSKVYWYKPSFDISFAKHSPGLVLLNFLIKYCLENKKTELDFTIGAEKFKSRYANTIRKNTSIYIYQSAIKYYYLANISKAKSIIKSLYKN